MSNGFITTREAAQHLYDQIKELSPQAQAWCVYGIQTSLGGFPRDLAMEARIALLPNEPKATA